MLPEIYSDFHKEVHFLKAFVEKKKHFIKIKKMLVYCKKKRSFFGCYKIPTRKNFKGIVFHENLKLAFK